MPETVEPTVQAFADLFCGVLDFEIGCNAIADSIDGFVSTTLWHTRPEDRREGYCKHGKYVGGIGIDWMCGPCEDGL